MCVVSEKLTWCCLQQNDNSLGTEFFSEGRDGCTRGWITTLWVILHHANKSDMTDQVFKMDRVRWIEHVPWQLHFKKAKLLWIIMTIDRWFPGDDCTKPSSMLFVTRKKTENHTREGGARPERTTTMWCARAKWEEWRNKLSEDFSFQFLALTNPNNHAWLSR